MYVYIVAVCYVKGVIVMITGRGIILLSLPPPLSPVERNKQIVGFEGSIAGLGTMLVASTNLIPAWCLLPCI